MDKSGSHAHTKKHIFQPVFYDLINFWTMVSDFKHYVDCLIKELGIDGSDGNPTYTASTFSKDEIVDNHMSVLSSFGISFPKEDCDLPSLYWIPKLHKDPYKQRFIAEPDSSVFLKEER